MHARQSLTIPAILSGLAMAATLPALAHHGWAGQGEEQIQVTGTVHKPVDLSGPHATMQIMSNGQVWDITLAGAAPTQRAGLKPDTLPVGTPVTVRGNRNSDLKRYEIKTVRVSSGGRNYDVYPDRLK